MDYFQIIDHPGSPYTSLNTLEKSLRMMTKDNPLLKKVEVCELRDLERQDATIIGFYIRSEGIESLIGHSFWVPGRKNYAQVDISEGGSGTTGYVKSIAMIYKYLNHQSRKIFEVGMNQMDLLKVDPSENIKKFKLVDVLNEDTSILRKLTNDLCIVKDPFSFIVMDTESAYLDGHDPTFCLGATWDMYHGLRQWREHPEELIAEFDKFDRIINYNGEAFDLGRVLRFGGDNLLKKSVDLYKVIHRAYMKEQEILRQPFARPSFQQKGELTLLNVAFTTMGVPKWETFYGPDKKEMKVAGAGDVMNHCIRDVEMTKDLFFYMIKHHHVHSISNQAISEKRLIETLFIGDELHSEIYNKKETPPARL